MSHVRLAALLCCILLTGCAGVHKVARIFRPDQLCRPSDEIFQRFACEHYQFCGGQAEIVDMAHDDGGWYIASYHGAQSEWRKIDWPAVSKTLCLKGDWPKEGKNGVR